MRIKHRNYEDSLIEALKDSEKAIAYLNAALMDEDQRVFLLALKDVLKVHPTLHFCCCKNHPSK